MNVSNRTQRASRTQGGQILAALLHAVLLLLVLGQIVYLASRYRVRVDMTSDRVWSLTDSTQRLLAKLDKRLVIEAYFSPKDQLPVSYRQTREVAENFLDELVQLGEGKVVVQRFDPNSDKAIADKATRVGVQPMNLRSQSATSLSLDQHWQGVRLVYGGDRQAVVSNFQAQSSFQAEATLTPRIKEVMTAEKRRFGYMEWPAMVPGQRNPTGIGWNMVRTHRDLEKRYEFQNYKDEDGALLPDDVDVLFLFRPKDLSDRQKYVLDQFVVGGGTLVVFADAAEYALGAQRTMTRVPTRIDAPGSERAFVDQLKHYGVDWRPKVLCDMDNTAQMPSDRFGAPFEYLAVGQQTRMGPQLSWVPYPYFFHAVAVDWAIAADTYARDANGDVDEQLAQRYRELFEPGLPSDDFLFQVYKQKLRRGPGLYWPTWTGLRQKAGGAVDLPEGVEGRVLMRSSPLVLVEDPPANLDPIGRDPAQVPEMLQRFRKQLMDRLAAEPRQQAPLMVEVTGRFSSFFANGERPQRPSEIKEAKARAAREGGDEEGVEGGEQSPSPDVGPPPPDAGGDAAAAAIPQERAMLTTASEPGRIVVVGDATFLRDDVLSGEYQRAGGPVSARLAMPFFAQMLDWLSEDRDLVDLQSRAPTDRTLSFTSDEEKAAGADPRDAEQRLRTRTNWLVWQNVAAPCLLLLLFGLVVWLVRRSQKNAFLHRTN